MPTTNDATKQEPARHVYSDTAPGEGTKTKTVVTGTLTGDEIAFARRFGIPTSSGADVRRAVDTTSRESPSVKSQSNPNSNPTSYSIRDVAQASRSLRTPSPLLTPIETNLTPTDNSFEKAANERKRKLRARMAEALRCACQEGDKNEVSRLLKRHEKLDKMNDCQGEPLTNTNEEADKSNDKDDEYESIINIPDSSGDTALSFCCVYGNIECVELLLRIPVLDINAANKQGKTALHRAAYNGHKHLVTLLAAAGSDLNFKDSGGNTALHCAIMNEFFDCAQVMLKYGAALDIENRDKLTVLNLIKKKSSSFERDELIRELKARGAVLGSGGTTPQQHKARSASFASTPSLSPSKESTMGRQNRTLSEMSTPTVPLPPSSLPTVSSPPRPGSWKVTTPEALTPGEEAT